MKKLSAVFLLTAIILFPPLSIAKIGVQMDSDSTAGAVLYTESIGFGLKFQKKFLAEGLAGDDLFLVGAHACYLFQYQ